MFANNSFAKVWQIQPKKDGAKSLNIQLSTSFKNKQTNQYEVDFKGYALLIGEAFKKAEKDLQAGDRIKILNCGCKRIWDKEKFVNHETFLIFDLEIQTEHKIKDASDEEFVPLPDNDEELPFASLNE